MHQKFLDAIASLASYHYCMSTFVEMIKTMSKTSLKTLSKTSWRSRGSSHEYLEDDKDHEDHEDQEDHEDHEDHEDNEDNGDNGDKEIFQKGILWNKSNKVH